MSENLSGRTLGRYNVLEQLGRGGMAAVYRAYQPSLDRFVAIKVIYPHLASDPDLLERFNREARAVASLRHPNIVQVYDFDVQDNNAFMAMEFINGPTLKAATHAVVRQGRLLPMPVVGQIVGQLAEALGYAHEHQLVHRDVKPANVMIRRPNGNENVALDDAALERLLLNLTPSSVVLTDFGVARIIKDSMQHTATGTILGSPAYMSPEQGRGERVDYRSDIYSLGIILYELLTGRVPFDADTPFAVVLKHISEPLPPPRILRPDLPEGLERAVLKALAKDPADRFQDAAAFGAAVREHARPAPAVSTPLPPESRPPAPAVTQIIEQTTAMPAAASPSQPAAAPGRPGWLVPLAVVAVVTLLVGGFFLFRNRPQQGATPPETGGTTQQPLAPEVNAALAAARERCGGPGCPAGADQAVQILTDALQQFPDNPQLLAARASTYLWWDPYTYGDTAMADLERALERDPQNAEALYARGLLQRYRDQPEPALADLNRAIELDPDHIAARLARAELLGYAPDYGEPVSASRQQVIADTTYILERDPQNVPALLLRGFAAYAGNDYAAVIADCTAILAIDPANHDARMLRANTYWYSLERPDDALADFSAALETDPENIEARQSRVILLATLGRIAEARLEADELIKRTPDNPDNLVLHGFTALASGELPAAGTSFERALLIAGPELRGGRYGRGKVLLEQGRPEAAAPDLEYVVQKPDELYLIWDTFFARHHQIFLDLAAVYRVTGNMEALGAMLNRAVETDGDWYRPYLERARFRLAQGDPAGAREDLRAALELAREQREREEIEQELQRLPGG